MTNEKFLLVFDSITHAARRQVPDILEGAKLYGVADRDTLLSIIKDNLKRFTRPSFGSSTIAVPIDLLASAMALRLSMMETPANGNEVSNIDRLMLDMRATLSSKGHDYETDVTVDRLGSFKQASILTYLNSSIDVCVTLIALKIVRLESLKGREPKNESMTDNSFDLVNYCLLLCALCIEKEGIV